MEQISAGDLEKFCYCPLSWKLRGEELTGETLVSGRESHDRMGRELRSIVRREGRASLYEKLVMTSSILATAFALIGAFVITASDAMAKGATLAVLSVLWALLAIWIFYKSVRMKGEEERERSELLIIIVAIVAIALAMNAFPLFGLNQEQALLAELIALLLLIAATMSLFLSKLLTEQAEHTRRSQHVSGRIAYVGEGGSPRILRSEKHGLTGRPDYILEVGGELVPVEVKTGRVPRGPLFSHIIQLAAYCLLLEDEGKISHGILRYGTVEHVIDFDQDLRGLLLSKLDQMRQAISSGEVHRDHERPGKCRSCSRREHCPERLY